MHNKANTMFRTAAIVFCLAPAVAGATSGAPTLAALEQESAPEVDSAGARSACGAGVGLFQGYRQPGARGQRPGAELCSSHRRSAEDGGSVFQLIQDVYFQFVTSFRNQAGDGTADRADQRQPVHGGTCREASRRHGAGQGCAGGDEGRADRQTDGAGAAGSCVRGRAHEKRCGAERRRIPGGQRRIQRFADCGDELHC